MLRLRERLNYSHNLQFGMEWDPMQGQMSSHLIGEGDALTKVADKCHSSEILRYTKSVVIGRVIPPPGSWGEFTQPCAHFFACSVNERAGTL